MSLMFSGSGDDSDTISSADSPVSANRQTRFSLKLLYFFSGVALLALIQGIFVQTSVLYAVFSAGLFTAFLFVWLWAVFELDVVRQLKITASKASVITASAVSAVLELIGIFLAGTSLIYASDMMLKTYGDFIDLILSHVRESFQNIANLLMEQSETLAWVAAVIFGVLSFFIVYLVMKRLIATRYSAIVKKEGISSVLLFALASALWVFVPLLPLYLTNINYVSLLFIVILASAYIIGTLFVYFISLLISRSSIVSFVVCVVGWFGLSLSETIIMNIFSGIPYCSLIFTVLLLVLMVAVGFGVSFLLNEFSLTTTKVSRIVIVVVAVFVIINLIPFIPYAIENNSAISDVQSGELSFTVDTSLSNPSIYWIHVDSMVDTTVLEEYWGEDTVGFSDKLEERGFLMNHDAYLTSHPRTGYVMPSVFSPTYYDEYQDTFPDDWYMDNVYPPYSVGMSYIQNNHEFIRAFNAAGYSTISVLSPGTLFLGKPANVVYTYDYNTIAISENYPDSVFCDICYVDLEEEIRFLKYSAYPLYVMFSALTGEDKCLNWYEKESSKVLLGSVDSSYVSDEVKESLFPGLDWLGIWRYGNFISAYSHAVNENIGPVLTIVYVEAAHEDHNTRLFYVDEFGHRQTADFENRLDGYYEQYLFAEKLVLYLVDEILSVNPDAIIIVQGDHGPHNASGDAVESELIPVFGEDVNPTEIWNHVLSAVRIPEQYQTDDYPEAIQNPRNIVRYLVNSYVGENYEYIPWEES